MPTIIAAISSALSLLNTGKQYNLINTVIASLMKWDQSDPSILLVNDLYGYMEVPAMTLAVCFALLEIYSVIQRQGSLSNVGPDVIVLPLIKALVCMYIIQQLPSLMGYTLGASNVLYDNFTEAIGKPLDKELSVTAFEGLSGLLAQIFFELIPSFLSLIGQVIACIAIIMQLITIRLDSLLRYVFLPFAVASIAHGGPQSGGMHYLKRFIGNFVIMAAIAVSIRITFLMCMGISLGSVELFAEGDVGGSVIKGLIGFLITSFVGPFAAVGTVSAVKQTVSEAFA